MTGSAPDTTTCPRCGAAMTCRPAGDCWCMELPARLPVPKGPVPQGPVPRGPVPKEPASGTPACLCPRCLAELLPGTDRGPSA
ncbi:cysteine-rich CWC family protein [Aliidongia dinghuensis]|uniref:cysteine-rich CWC family protein n=1 Tax=Aliidongia dinghuensis TaxID=1867774 RepID=UPI00166347ED